MLLPHTLYISQFPLLNFYIVNLLLFTKMKANDNEGYVYYSGESQKAQAHYQIPDDDGKLKPKTPTTPLDANVSFRQDIGHQREFESLRGEIRRSLRSLRRRVICVGAVAIALMFFCAAIAVGSFVVFSGYFDQVDETLHHQWHEATPTTMSPQATTNHHDYPTNVCNADQGWNSHHMHRAAITFCYRVSESAMSWYDALKYCSQSGPYDHGLDLEGDYEYYNAVLPVLNELKIEHGDAWTGMNLASLNHEDTQWLSDILPVTSQQAQSFSNCLYLHLNGTGFDVDPCYQLKRVVCERDLPRR